MPEEGEAGRLHLLKCRQTTSVYVNSVQEQNFHIDHTGIQSAEKMKLNVEKAFLLPEGYSLCILSSLKWLLFCCVHNSQNIVNY